MLPQDLLTKLKTLAIVKETPVGALIAEAAAGKRELKDGPEQDLR